MDLNRHGIIDLNAPRHTFKYQPINKYSLLNLENNQLWASHPSEFNDPFEFKFTQIGKNLTKNEIDQFIHDIDKFKVVCLSQDPANILMWSHYADFHKGMCLGFYHETLTYAVNYSDEFPRIDFKNNDPKLKGLQMYRVIHSKSKQWEYEKERRITLTPGTRSEQTYPGELFLIIFGLRTPIEDIRKVRSRIKDPSVIFWQCKYIANQYNLGFGLAPE